MIKPEVFQALAMCCCSSRAQLTSVAPLKAAQRAACYTTKWRPPTNICFFVRVCARVCALACVRVCAFVCVFLLVFVFFVVVYGGGWVSVGAGVFLLLF